MTRRWTREEADSSERTRNRGSRDAARTGVAPRTKGVSVVGFGVLLVVERGMIEGLREIRRNDGA